MTILLQSLVIMSETRLRLVFTNSLGSGAFGAPAPAYYTFENTDGRAPAPTVQAALVVPSSPTVVELVFTPPLAKGPAYLVKAVGVPALDLSTTAAGTELDLRWGLTEPKVNVEPLFRNRQRLLYGVDLLWNGTDFQETAAGDLDRVEGTANVTKALHRGVEANELPWDKTYGGKARQFIDSPSTTAGTLRGSVAAQLKRDPRVRSAPVKFVIEDAKTFLFADPVLISGEKADRVSIVVPSDT